MVAAEYFLHRNIQLNLYNEPSQHKCCSQAEEKTRRGRLKKTQLNRKMTIKIWRLWLGTTPLLFSALQSLWGLCACRHRLTPSNWILLPHCPLSGASPEKGRHHQYPSSTAELEPDHLARVRWFSTAPFTVLTRYNSTHGVTVSSVDTASERSVGGVSKLRHCDVSVAGKNRGNNIERKRRSMPPLPVTANN